MQRIAKAPDNIILAAADQATRHGFALLTVASVAKAARVSAALVHYHFDTKQALIVATANRLAGDRAAGLRAALAAGAGLATLDALWSCAARAASEGVSRSWLELIALAPRDDRIASVIATSRATELAAVATRLPSLLHELGAAPAPDVEVVAAAILLCCDGVTQALLARAHRALVRSAYDAFWLALVDARPRAGPPPAPA
jgi:AcrR family transcriptional regulator